MTDEVQAAWLRMPARNSTREIDNAEDDCRHALLVLGRAQHREAEDVVEGRPVASTVRAARYAAERDYLAALERLAELRLAELRAFVAGIDSPKAQA